MAYFLLFNQGYIERTPKEGIHIPTEFDFLRRIYERNSDQIKNYYQSRNFFVKNTYFLIRVLNQLPLYPDMDIFSYARIIEDRLDGVLRTFRVTSEVQRGVIHPGYMFGQDNDEVYISVYNSTNPDFIRKNWKTYNPIKIITQPADDLQLLLPTGKDHENKKGLVVLEIDFIGLAIKYREFYKEKKIVNLYTGEVSELNIQNFIYKYVINLMIDDIIDTVMLNRLMDRFYGIEPKESRYKHVFKILKPYKQIEQYIENTLDTITSKPMEFVNVLRNIKLLRKEDASIHYSYDFFVQNRQLLWAYILGRIDIMKFLVDLKVSNKKNLHHLNDWKRLFVRIENDRGFWDLLDYEKELEIKEKIRVITEA